ncbi:enoyl-CoA hydratase-related protein [Bradyrhizobium sp. 1]|uniref:enoyl-CoA hydratase-related protein n=1 Tax=Bradyrhizobium sp. 1 TaxID=241591 RepID=UPI001FFAA21D|nr:enoyl-CoA hydratase-related protein [Bradyrhizobium sp. 1]MCK1394458.1 enoyl-CoA hydratase/isomerase family protein [Bradyrhizobium sp. 1]
MTDQVLFDVRDNVATITLNAPAVLNAVSTEMLVAMQEALAKVAERSRQIRCVVLTGEGRAFCAGADLGHIDTTSAISPLESLYHPLVRRLRDLPVPFMTVVNGLAAGVGMSLALMGDFILCAKSAYFLQAFRNVGLVPDGGATWLLPRIVGRPRAMRLSLLAEKLPSDTAMQWGLVSEVVEDGDLREAAARYAQRLADGPTYALALTRALYWRSDVNSLEDQLDLENTFQRKAMGAPEFMEGVAAFKDKRKPCFREMALKESEIDWG